MITRIESVAIIGRGKVGQSLAQLATLKGYKTELIGRDQAQQKKACKNTDLIIIAVNDEAINTLAGQLVSAIVKPVIICQCSGALNSDELNNLQAAGALTASCHPLNTFPTLEAALKTFSSPEHASYLFAEGDPKALPLLARFYEDLGFSFKQIEKEAKTHYHLACTMACNYLSVLMHSSLNIAESAGLERAEFWLALSPLINKTLQNISNYGSLSSLSGPIARGDIQTTQRHLIALNDEATEIPQLMYRVLGKAAAKMALERAQLNSEEYKRIIDELED